MKTKTIKIYCSNCRTQLYRYEKKGNGHLVKCFVERIVKDYTEKGNPLSCPKCDETFARFTMIRGKPANKIIQGKVFATR